MSADFTREPGGNFSSWQKRKCLECQCQNHASLLPSQLFPFPSIVLTVLENDAARGKARETTSLVKQLQCLLVLRVFDLHSFGYTRLRKIVNIKKIVRFTTQNQSCAIFGYAQAKVVFLWKNYSLFT